MGMTRIYVKLRGNIPAGFHTMIRHVLKEFYARAKNTGYKVPILVEVIIYEDSQGLLREITSHAAEAGVAISAIYPLLH